MLILFLKKCVLYYLGEKHIENFLLEPVKNEDKNLNFRSADLNNLILNVEELNALADQQNLPLEFLHGFVQKIELNWTWTGVVPPSGLVYGLRLTARPKEKCDPATTMFASMASNKSEIFEYVKVAAASKGKIKGSEELLNAFRQALKTLTLTIIDSVLQIECQPHYSPTGVAILLNIKSINYKNKSLRNKTCDVTKEETEKKEEKSSKKENETSSSANTEVISVCIKGITLSTAEFNRQDFDDDSTYDYYASNKNRNVILIGKFEKPIEVVYRTIKRDNLPPQISIEISIGSLLLFLTPRQVHLLMEFIDGLTNPELWNPSKSSTSRTSVVKPSSNTERCETMQEGVRRYFNSMSHFQSGKIEIGQGWGTGGYDDDSSNSKNMVGSAISAESMTESTMSVSGVSYFSANSGRTGRTSAKSNPVPKVDSVRFVVHAELLGIVILHEELLTESLEIGTALTPSSVQQARNVSTEFFKSFAEIVNETDFHLINQILDEACKYSHLRLLLGTVQAECEQRLSEKDFSLCGFADVANLQVNESLYDSNKHEINVDLLKFNNEGDSPKSSNLRFNFKHIKKRESRSGPKTDLLCSLDKCLIDLDVSIINRINALINHVPICAKIKKNPWAETTNETVSKIDFKVISPEVTVLLRFPILDFRLPHDPNKVPWWKRNIRPDYLSLRMKDMTFQTIKQKNKNYEDYEIQCRYFDVFYHENMNSTPLHIAKAGLEDRKYISMDYYLDCKINIKIVPPKEVRRSKPPALDPMTMSIAGYLHNQQEDKGPFTSKRVFYEGNAAHRKNQKDFDSKELLVPGDKHETDNFIKKARNSARVQFDVFLPNISVQFLSKDIYEVIYNRINNDLLLWEPSAPKVKLESVYDPHSGVNLDDDDFMSCRSAVSEAGLPFDNEYGEEEEEEEGDVFYTKRGTRIKLAPKTQLMNEEGGESTLTVNVNIDRGVVLMCAPVRDKGGNIVPNHQSEFLTTFNGGNIFFVNGYLGNKDLGYLCVRVNKGDFNHCETMSIPSQPPPLKDVGARIGSHLRRTVHKTDPSMIIGDGRRGGKRDMITVCVKIERSHETHNVKNIAVGLGFNQVTLHHITCPEPNSWLSQLIDFFDVKDFAIPGYDAKDILSQLFVHFWDSSVDYRPLYLPIKAVLTVGHFSISSHLSAEINKSTLRFIAEDCCLFLSQSRSLNDRDHFSAPANLQRDYINVIELGQFDLSLMTSDKKNNDTPHFDLRASNNEIYIRTCADSARILFQFIQYLASDGDLIPPDSLSSSGNSYASPSHQPVETLVNVDNNQPAPVVVSEELKQKMCNLIEEALSDFDPTPPPSTEKRKPKPQYGARTQMYCFPDESPSEPFQPLPQVTTELGAAAFDPDLGNTDDEFDFIDAEPGSGIRPKGGELEIKWLTEDPVRVVENHFNVPTERRDPLSTPPDFPVPTERYTLCEMSIIWCMYGGNDFISSNDRKNIVNVPDPRLKFTDRIQYKENQVVIGTQKVKEDRTWYKRGGIWRRRDVQMQLHLSKIQFRHETYPENSTKVSRQVLAINNVEILDKMKTSRINKFLSQYVSQQRPKQSNSNMVYMRMNHEITDQRLRTVECSLKVQVMPLRLYIDQDALEFLIDFFKDLGSEMEDDDIARPASSSKSTPVRQPPVLTVNTNDKEEIQIEQVRKAIDESLLMFLEENKIEEQLMVKDEPTVSSNVRDQDAPIYFKEVLFNEVPIKLDYVGKGIKNPRAIHGILMGLAQLNCTELKLKRIMFKKGILGLNNLLQYLVNEWLSDLRKNQIPNILSGVGPIPAILMLFHGIRDLILIPLQQYRNDGKIFRGLHRGAHSFATSTLTAFADLLTKCILAIHSLAEFTYDVCNPMPIKRGSFERRLREPRDFREGLTNALNTLKEGIQETRENIKQAVRHEHEQRGYRGAVGGVIRQIPPTFIKPIIMASEATTNVLEGVKYQLLPDASHEQAAKWRTEEDEEK